MPLLLILGYVWPEPNSSAAGWRMLSLIQLFRQNQWQIIFACPAELSVHRFDLTSWGIEEVQIELNSSVFDEQLSKWQPDIVLFDRFMLEEQFGWRVDELCPQALKLLDSEDLHCLRSARQQAFKQQRALTKADLRSELAQREIAAILRSDLTLTISEYEMALLQEEYAVPATQLLYAPFLVNAEQKRPPVTFAERQHCCFIGNFRHEPNWQAVLQLRRIWPQIRKQLPEVELHIYGAYPPPKATALHDKKLGFLIKGWAEDSLQVLGQSRLCLAPIPFGAGLKGKFIDAMLTGTPSITTSVGAEAMTEPDTGHWCGIIADSDEALISATVTLYQDAERWLHAQQIGDNILQQRFLAKHWQPLIWQQITQVQQNLAAHRLQHFTGSMLKHHHQRSTKFMAQWIEAKNKLAVQSTQTEEPQHD